MSNGSHWDSSFDAASGRSESEGRIYDDTGGYLGYDNVGEANGAYGDYSYSSTGNYSSLVYDPAAGTYTSTSYDASTGETSTSVSDQPPSP